MSTRVFHLIHIGIKKGGLLIEEKNENTNIYRLLRIARNKQLKEVADELMVTPSYIHAIEKGNRIPSKRLLRDYAKVLDVDEDILKTFDVGKDENSKFEKVLLELLKIICDEK